MAFSNTYNTTSPGSAASNREDLAKWFSMLAPEKTPFLSALKKNTATAMNHEWTVDGLSLPDTTAVIEGADVSAFSDKFADVSRLGNFVQKLRRTWKVSDMQDLVASAGPQDAARAKGKSVMELKRDVETVLLSTQDRLAGSAGVASTMRGLGDWIDSAGPADVPADYRTPAASIHSTGALTEALFDGILTSLFRASGDTQNVSLLADTSLRAVITNFANTAGTSGDYRSINQNADGHLKNTVGIYEGDYGQMDIVNMNPVTAPDTSGKQYGYVCNHDFLGLASLKTLGSESLENQGGGKRGFVDWAGTLEVMNPGALGKITDITA